MKKSGGMDPDCTSLRMTHLAHPLLALLLGRGHEAKLGKPRRKNIEREFATLVPLLLNLDHIAVVQTLIVGGEGGW